MGLKEKIDELIAKLPEASRPYAQIYADGLQALAADEAMAIVDVALAGDTVTAYSQMFESLSTEQQIALSDKTNAVLAVKANEIAAQKEAMDAFIRTLVMLGISVALA